MGHAELSDWTAGRFLSLTTTFGEDINGQIITYDRSSNLIVLLQEGSLGDGSGRKVRILKANFVEKLSYLGQGEDPLDPNKCFIDLAALQAREDNAVRQAEIEAERIGFGVTGEAQSIYDALSKTLPVCWDKTVIVVMNEVRVSSPYHPENVFGGTPAANNRVKKVIELERKRLRV